MNTSGDVFVSHTDEPEQKKRGIKGGKKRTEEKHVAAQQEKGKSQAIQDLAKEDAKNKKKLADISEKGNSIICRAKTVFPFDLFPDEITVDPNQINIVQRNFFHSASMISIPVKNVADILVEVALMFGTIKIIDQAFKSTPITIKFLHKNDAMQIRRTIQGLIVANTEDVNVAGLQQEQLRKNLPTLGAAAGIENTI